MPNWCENNITVTGPSNALALFASKSSQGEGLLSSLYPCPESLQKTTSGSAELMYHLYYGEIPSYVWGWEDVIKSKIKKDDPEVKDKLLAHFKENRGDYWKDAKEQAELYKYNLETHGFMSWYEWCLKKWGTKWDVPHSQVYLNAEEEDQDKDTDVWEASFDTAWGPPVEWVEHVSKNFPELLFRIEYSEMGMWFAGYATYIDGEETESKNGKPEDFDFCEAIVESVREMNEEDEGE